MDRRSFMKTSASGIVCLGSLNLLSEALVYGDNKMTTRQFLSKAVLRRKDVDKFLDPKSDDWACFDAELGYRLRNSKVRDGIDGSLSFASFEKTGQRKMINYADVPCRINTYGDSFTYCQEVSDGETWQEILAAHIAEPIRNYGIGGYGVYQAYRRMVREEQTSQSAEYVILNVFDDDHYRNILKWRWVFCGVWRDAIRENDGKTLQQIDKGMLHANPWVHLRVNPQTGKITEKPNPYPTGKSLYKLCDEQHVYENFKDDLVVQIVMAQKTGRFEFDTEIKQLCKLFDIKDDFNNPRDCKKIADELFTKCAIETSIYTIKKAVDFAKKNNKKLMIVLSYGQPNVVRFLKTGERFDAKFIKFLKDNNILYVDSLAKHAAEFKNFRISVEEYSRRFYNIAHHTPLGNHFFAYAIKDEVVDWLDPKPPTYQ